MGTYERSRYHLSSSLGSVILHFLYGSIHRDKASTNSRSIATIGLPSWSGRDGARRCKQEVLRRLDVALRTFDEEARLFGESKGMLKRLNRVRGATFAVIENNMEFVMSRSPRELKKRFSKTSGRGAIEFRREYKVTLEKHINMRVCSGRPRGAHLDQ